MVEAMRIDSSGNVGIGTSSPTGRLHVHSGSAGSVTANGNADNLIVESSATGGISILTPDASHGYLMFGSPTSNEGAILRYRDNDNIFAIGTEDADGILQFRTGAGTERMRIDSSGNVFIGGTTAASADIALNANGNITAGDDYQTTSGKGVTILGRTDSSVRVRGLDLQPLFVGYKVGEANATSIIRSGRQHHCGWQRRHCRLTVCRQHSVRCISNISMEQAGLNFLRNLGEAVVLQH